MIPENEPELIGRPTDEVPKLDPDGEHCRGKKAKRDPDGTSIFRGYCRNPPGKGTDHVGSGRCKFHDNQGSGPDNPAWKHGIYSDVVRPEDKDTLERLRDFTKAEKLADTLDLEIMKLRRAVALLDNPDREADFWDLFGELVESASQGGELDPVVLGELTKMLDTPHSAQLDLMREIRQAARDLHKITDGEQVRVEHGVNEEELAELQETFEDLL